MQEIEEVRVSETLGPDGTESVQPEAGVEDTGALVVDAEGGARPEFGGPEPASDSISPEVARARAELAGVSELDLAEHPDAYQRIHLELQGALTSIDDA
jgi:hypothetical protein